MKFWAKISILAVIVLTSCSVNDVKEWESPYDVVYEAMVGMNTKADDVVKGEYPVDRPFDVWAFSLAKPKTWADNGDEAVMAMDRMKSKHVSGIRWIPENGQKWGPASETMSFFAASPSGRAEYDNDWGISFNDYSLDDGVVPMYVDGATDLDKHVTRGFVTMTFKNALSTVGFSAKASVSGGHKIIVKKIVITNIFTQGDFSSRPYPLWRPKGEPQEIVFFEGSKDLGDNARNLCEGIYMIPQNANVEVKMICDISSGSGALVNQEFKANMTVNWSPGKQTSYMLKVANDLSFTVEKDPN